LFELVSVFSRLLTLGARLTMNAIAGKLLVCIGRRFLRIMLVSGQILRLRGVLLTLRMLVLVRWEVVVIFIQSYIFLSLVIRYIREIPFYSC